MNRKCSSFIILLAFVLIAIAMLSISSGDARADTHVWDGGGVDSKASSAANWNVINGPSDVCPNATDDIVFNSTSTKSCIWDLSIDTYGAFSIKTGYSGTVIQTTDMHITAWSVAGGIFTGNATKNIYVTSISLTGGTITAATCNVVMVGDGGHLSSSVSLNEFLSLKISANASIDSHIRLRGLIVDIGKTLTISSSYTYYKAQYEGAFTNNGNIISIGSAYILYSSSWAVMPVVNMGNFNSNVEFTASGQSTNIIFNMVAPFTTNGYIKVNSAHATFTVSINTAGYTLTSASLQIGPRGIVSSNLTGSICAISGAVSVSANGKLDATNIVSISCGGWDSSAGTWIPSNSVVIVSDGVLIKISSGQTFNNLNVDGDDIKINQDTNITGDLSFIGLNISHPYGLYINGIRTSSVSTTPSGTYSLGSGVFAWDNATLKITPVITIDLWERTDAFRNVVWEGYDYWADHDADAAVTWSLVTTGTWLTTDANGNVTGEAGDDSTYYYTLTATAASGEQTSVSGFIIVENSINEGLNTAFSWISPLIGLMAIGLIAVALSSLSWRSKKK